MQRAWSLFLAAIKRKSFVVRPKNVCLNALAQVSWAKSTWLFSKHVSLSQARSNSLSVLSFFCACVVSLLTQLMHGKEIYTPEMTSTVMNIRKPCALHKRLNYGGRKFWGRKIPWWGWGSWLTACTVEGTYRDKFRLLVKWSLGERFRYTSVNQRRYVTRARDLCVEQRVFFRCSPVFAYVMHSFGTKPK